ncbi:MAG: HAD-IB family phosphatase [Ardenticatenaceae bacterium]|nr:HAD-IB family phosphatase [Ardenticatenaceae bacterium]
MSMDIVASDLEGTLSAGQTWRGMRTYLEAHGQADAFRRFFRRRLPALVLYRLHLVDDRAFKERWILDVLRLFTGYTPTAFADVAQWVVESELWPQRRQAVVAELEQHRENGRRVLVISGLFQPMLDVFTGRLGVEGIGTPLLFANGRFTGQIAAPFNVGDYKVAQLQQHMGSNPLVAAYGDTEGDIPMLRLSQEAVAVHPDRTLRREAAACGWRILE